MVTVDQLWCKRGVEGGINVSGIATDYVKKGLSLRSKPVFYSSWLFHSEPDQSGSKGRKAPQLRTNRVKRHRPKNRTVRSRQQQHNTTSLRHVNVAISDKVKRNTIKAVGFY